MTIERPMFPPRAESKDSISVLTAIRQQAGREPTGGLFRGLKDRQMIAVDADELQTLRVRAKAYVDQGAALKVLLQMAEVVDGLLVRAPDDHVRLPFATRRLGAMIRQFELSYRLRNFEQQGGAA